MIEDRTQLDRALSTSEIIMMKRFGMVYEIQDGKYFVYDGENRGLDDEQKGILKGLRFKLVEPESVLVVN